MRIPILIISAALLVSGCHVFVDDEREPAAEDEGPIKYVRNSDFTGPRLEVFIELEDGRRATVNSLDDAITTRSALTPIPGHQARDWTLLKETEHGTSVVFAVASWDPNNPPDYIMAGWWAEFPDQSPPDLDLRQYAGYAILDGPELDARFPPDLPPEGQATYLGQTGGLYGYLPPGGGEQDFLIEEYEGIITISTDFAERTLHGCVGCVGDLVSRRAHFSYFLGDEQRFDSSAFIADYEIHLGAATLEEDGKFGSDDVAVLHPERGEAGETSGHWGGLLSSTPDADGNPRLVSGFTSATFEGDDGRWGGFFGSFLALSEQFQESGE